MKKILCVVMALCLLVMLGGCAGKGGEEPALLPTLEPASVDYEAPDGDRVVGGPGDYEYFVPEKNQAKLGVRSVHLEGLNLRDTAEELVRRVLREVNGSGVLRGVSDLDLYPDAPIEVSRGICTVNFSSSALQLEHDDYYKLSVAVSTTLCALDDIR